MPRRVPPCIAPPSPQIVGGLLVLMWVLVVVVLVLLVGWLAPLLRLRRCRKQGGSVHLWALGHGL